MTILSSIPEDTASVFFSISYTEGDTTGTKTVEASTSISISKRSLVQIDNISWSKGIIEPGDIVDVDVYMENVGKGSLKDSTVTFGNSTLPFIPAEGDTEAYMGSLSAGQTKIVSFSILVSKDASTIAYRVPITVQYYDDAGTMHTDVKYIGMRVSGEPEFVLALEDDSKAYTGKTGEMTISLANRGTATARFLTIRFDSSLDTIPSEYYVGNLDPDDYETVTLELDLSNIQAGKKALLIEMLYKDPYNQEVVESSSIEFTVHKIPPIEISPTTAFLAVAALAAIVYWKRSFFTGIFKKKRK